MSGSFHRPDAEAGLGTAQDGVGGVQADDVLDLLTHPVRLGGGQVDLVQDRDDLVIVVDGLVDVGQGLGLDALGGIDHQQAALAGGEGARDLIGEVDVARRVHQVQDVIEPVLRPVVQAHGLGLDGNAPLLLDIHGIENLRRHLARGQPAGELDQPVGQGGFAVVNVGYHTEVSDAVDGRGRHGRAGSTAGPDRQRARRSRGISRTGRGGLHRRKGRFRV